MRYTMLKITPKLLSIPPYLSATWEEIQSLIVQKTPNGPLLVVRLHHAPPIEIPGLSENDLDAIFQAHANTPSTAPFPPLHILLPPEGALPDIFQQISTLLSPLADPTPKEPEEEVPLEDLQFREWDIEEKGAGLYLVKNPLEPSEEYRVFLGESPGCTCGQKGCEHLHAVLRS